MTVLAFTFAACQTPVNDETYILSFNPNGATGGEPPPSEKAQGGDFVTLPGNTNNMIKENFIFGGWNTKADGTGTPYSTGSDFTMPNKNTTLYANWNDVYTTPTYTVSFNSNGGSSVPGQNVVSGQPVNQPTDPILEGYTFKGWYSDSGLTIPYDFSVPVMGTFILYAMWEERLPDTYQVIFESNGGSYVESQIISYGGTVSPPVDPTQPGYNFICWCGDSGLNYLYNFSTLVTGDTTIYAKWLPSTYMITYLDAGGGTFSGVHEGGYPVTHTYGTETVLDNPAKTGYTFEGWFVNSDGTGTALTSLTTTGYTANITLYAKWAPITYTITYLDVGGGVFSGVHEDGYPDTHTYGTETDLDTPAKTWNTFEGWFVNSDGTGDALASLATTGYTANITLYAKWVAVSLDSITSLANKLAWLQSNAVSGGNYILKISTDEAITPETLSYSGRNNITIHLEGTGSNRIISLSSNGSMFTVDSGITLVLDNYITLQGHNSNTDSLVMVDGALEMNMGSKITGNTGVSGGGVYVTDNGTFNMSGGIISDSTAGYGGGVYVASGTVDISTGVLLGNRGTFAMSGGTISGNTGVSGGGVFMSGIFTMSGGTISNNIGGGGGGGGVYVDSYTGTFTMSGNATITDNSATSDGGGVYVAGRGSSFTMSGSTIISGNTSVQGGGVYIAGSFTMNGGTIFGNTAISAFGSGRGSGVYIAGSFTMNGGEISGNTAGSANGSGYGGGVYMSSGSFTMNGGAISGNTAVMSTIGVVYGGGGVYVSGGNFTMSSGEISGNTAWYGGGVYMGGGTFRIITGTIYGSGEVEGTSNNAAGGAALYGYAATQYGTFSGETWVSNGDLSTTDDTIRVVNGNLQ